VLWLGKVGANPIDAALSDYYNRRSMARDSGFQKLEEKARNLIERTISKMLGGSPIQRELARQMVSQIESSLRSGRECDRFWIHLPPQEYDSLLEQSQSIESDLSEYLSDYRADEGNSSRGAIEVQLVQDDILAPSDAYISSACAVRLTESTQTLKKVDIRSAKDEVKALDAFLIHGSVHIPLNSPSISLGRLLANDIVINTKSVSRRHAIIRWQQGVFVLHDLGSKAGTLKNGSRIRESVLSPGDVIQIDSSSYIYGEGLTPLDRELKAGSEHGGTTQALSRPLP
jgi:hypothetical protein